MARSIPLACIRLRSGQAGRSAGRALRLNNRMVYFNNPISFNIPW